MTFLNKRSQAQECLSFGHEGVFSEPGKIYRKKVTNRLRPLNYFFKIMNSFLFKFFIEFSFGLIKGLDITSSGLNFEDYLKEKS
jgi:hypothetical protein